MMYKAVMYVIHLVVVAIHGQLVTSSLLLSSVILYYRQSYPERMHSILSFSRSIFLQLNYYNTMNIDRIFTIFIL